MFPDGLWVAPVGASPPGSQGGVTGTRLEATTHTAHLEPQGRSLNPFCLLGDLQLPSCTAFCDVCGLGYGASSGALPLALARGGVLAGPREPMEGAKGNRSAKVAVLGARQRWCPSLHQGILGRPGQSHQAGSGAGSPKPMAPQEPRRTRA